MTATGIGAAVRRKEDYRFITGKGHYTDDINRPGQAYAYFVRSPHAHATIKSIDSQDGLRYARRGPAVLTGADTRRRQDRRTHLRLDGPFRQDGSPMKMRAASALANGKVCYVGDEVAVVIADSWRRRKRRRREGRRRLRVLPAVVDPEAAAKPGAPQIHDIAPNNTVYNWHLGNPRPRSTPPSRPPLTSPSSILSIIALCPRRSSRAPQSASMTLAPAPSRCITPPESARRAARPLRLCRHRTREQAARDCAGRRRRFRFEDLHLRRRDGRVWAAKKVGRPVKWTAERSESFLVDAHGRDHVTHAELAFDADGKITACASKPSPISARIIRRSVPVCRLICTRCCCRGSTISRRSIARSTQSILTPRRSTRYRGAGRPEATFVVERLVERRRARDGPRSGRLPRNNFIDLIPASNAGFAVL